MTEKLDILCFGAHPDDVELGCGGTIALEVANGKKVGIIDLTQGELGTRGTAQTRLLEAQAAQNILGVTVRVNLKLADGFFENNQNNQLKIIEIIRNYQPDIVLCNAPKDRHTDHAKAANLVTEACFLSGLLKIQTNQLSPWRPSNVFHYIQWINLQPSFVVDISNYMQTKINAVLAYKTQFYDPNSQEPMTPIASKNFLESITYRAQDLGRLAGVDFAEGFITAKTPLIKTLFDIY